MELSMIIAALGLKGATSHRTYERMVETWIDPSEPIPTLEECQAKWNEIYPDIELNMLWGKSDIEEISIYKNQIGLNFQIHLCLQKKNYSGKFIASNLEMLQINQTQKT